MELTSEQRAAAERIGERIARDAHHMADLTAAFLKQQGYKSRRQEECVPSDPVEQGPAASFLLQLAAAIRLRAWEHAGIQDALPEELPPAEEALQVAVHRLLNESMDESTDDPHHLPMLVFRATHQHLARSYQTDFATDVLFDARDLDEEQFLESLADFLWANRNTISEAPS